MRVPKTLVKQIIGHLAASRPAVIYVFGSHGTAAQHPGSDLDLAFLPTRPITPLLRHQWTNQLSELLGKEVDLIDLSQASTVFAKEVIRTGSILADADPLRRQQFEMQ